MSRVFLAYSHSDQDVAEEFRNGLVTCGFEVWSDEAIVPGAGLAESIAAGMSAADAVVFLLGKQTDRTAWTSVEIGMAAAMGKRVIPVLTDRNAEVPVTLRGVQWLEAINQSSRKIQIDQLCDLLRGSMSPRSTSEGLEATRQASRALQAEQIAYQRDYEWRSVALVRLQIIIGFVALLASGAGLLAASAASSAVVVGIASAVIATLVSILVLLLDSRLRGKADG